MIRTVSDNEFRNKINNSKGVLLVDFFATWCGPCKILSPVLEDLNSEMRNVEFIKVDVDAASDLADQYKIKTVPTMMIFKRGKLVDTITGFKPKDNIKEILQKHL
jgi:thioredoxin 1